MTTPDRARVRLTEISPRAYEHPADRAALTALRKVRGFDQVLRWLSGLFGGYLSLKSASVQSDPHRATVSPDFPAPREWASARLKRSVVCVTSAVCSA